MTDIHLRNIPDGQTEKSFIDSSINNIINTQKFFDSSFVQFAEHFDSDTQFEIYAIKEAIDEFKQRLENFQMRCK